MLKRAIYCSWIIALIFSCKNANDTVIDIKIRKEINSDISFNNYYNSFLAKSLDDRFPKYYDEIKSKYKIEGNSDSIFISTLITDNRRFEYDLYLNGYIDEWRYNELNIDSLKEKLKPIQIPRHFAVRYKNNKQYVIFDSDSDTDFEDEIEQEFDKDFRMNLNYETVYNDLPIFDLNFSHTYKGKNYHHTRKIVIYPQSHSCYSGALSDDEIINKTRILVKFKDYWKGEINLNNAKYDVAIQGLMPNYLTILIKPSTLKFSSDNSIYNNNFSYKLKDTIKLSNNLFVIDTVANNKSSLILKKIKTEKEFYSYRIGYKIKDFRLTSLENEVFQIKDFTSNKEYTLLDFWGTWCPPCRKLTPELKRINSTYSASLNIIGIAVDRSIEPVKEYVAKNEMNWTQVYINNKNRSGTINRELKITKFPTFLLIDKNQNIIYRGSGEKALIEIEKIINRYSG